VCLCGFCTYPSRPMSFPARTPPIASREHFTENVPGPLRTLLTVVVVVLVKMWPPVCARRESRKGLCVRARSEEGLKQRRLFPSLDTQGPACTQPDYQQAYRAHGKVSCVC
jgi:hypothetical protein